MISLCFRKIPSPPPPPSRCVRMNQRSQSTQGVSRPVWGPQDVIPTSTALLASSVPARHLAIHPRLSLGSGKAAGCRLCSVRPPVLGLSICLTPPAIALITPFPNMPGVTASSGPLHLLSSLSRMLFPACLLGSLPHLPQAFAKMSSFQEGLS